MRHIGVALVLAVVWLHHACHADPDGLALTPPMGWNACNAFGWGDNVNENLYRQCVEALISTGMRDAGYVYVNLDDSWQAGSRDGQGNLQENRGKWPSGMKAFGDWLHGKGFTFGTYTDVGPTTCGIWPGSMRHEYQDAATFARWGVDYVKDDFCNSEGLRADSIYQVMHDAIKASGRPMVLEICEWGTSAPWRGWGARAGHLRRTTTDIIPMNGCWDCTRMTGMASGPWGPVPIAEFNQQPSVARAAGPGHWNHMDFVNAGNPGLTDSESKAHFSLWCIMAAPLICGTDVRNMRQTIKDIYLNREMIAVDQDSLGTQGQRVWIDTANTTFNITKTLVVNGANLQVFVKPLRDSSRAVLLFNKGAAAANIAVTWKQLQWPDNTRAAVRDLWAHKDLGYMTKSFSASVGPHDVVCVRITPEKVPVSVVVTPPARHQRSEFSGPVVVLCRERGPRQPGDVLGLTGRHLRGDRLAGIGVRLRVPR